MSTLNLISFAVHVIIFILLKKKENTWNEISMNKLKLNMRKLQFRNSNSITRGTFVHFLLLQQALEIVLVKKQKKWKSITCLKFQLDFLIYSWSCINSGNKIQFLLPSFEIKFVPDDDSSGEHQVTISGRSLETAESSWVCCLSVVSNVIVFPWWISHFYYLNRNVKFKLHFSSSLSFWLELQCCVMHFHFHFGLNTKSKKLDFSRRPYLKRCAHLGGEYSAHFALWPAGSEKWETKKKTHVMITFLFIKRNCHVSVVCRQEKDPNAKPTTTKLNSRSCFIAEWHEKLN